MLWSSKYEPLAEPLRCAEILLLTPLACGRCTRTTQHCGVRELPYYHKEVKA